MLPGRNCVVVCKKINCSSKALPYCVLTCEHATNHVPRRWSRYLHNKNQLNSHAGYDIGALDMARRLATHLRAPLYSGRVSRLLVDLNRSLHHRRLFSDPIKQLSADEHAAILARYYQPFRQEILSAIDTLSVQHPVVHLSVHSFTPVWNGAQRTTGLGLLYDPARSTEVKFCTRLQEHLKRGLPELPVRRNYPYRGTADGHTTALRKRYPARRYIGVELEFNQELLDSSATARRSLALTIANAIRDSL